MTTGLQPQPVIVPDGAAATAASFGPRRLLWLLALKLVLVAFAVLVALRVYGLI